MEIWLRMGKQRLWWEWSEQKLERRVSVYNGSGGKELQAAIADRAFNEPTDAGKKGNGVVAGDATRINHEFF